MQIKHTIHKVFSFVYGTFERRTRKSESTDAHIRRSHKAVGHGVRQKHNGIFCCQPVLFSVNHHLQFSSFADNHNYLMNTLNAGVGNVLKVVDNKHLFIGIAQQLMLLAKQCALIVNMTYNSYHRSNY